jgi:hypothetical protein
MSDPIVLTGWLAGLSLFVVLLGVAPLLAMRRPVLRSPMPLAPDPYRAPVPGAPGPAPRDGRGVLGAVLGILYVLSAPMALLLALGRALSWDSATANDGAGTLILLALAPVGLYAGVALVVAGSRMAAGTPTTRLNAAALALFAAYFWATGIFVWLEPFGAVHVPIALASFTALACAGVYVFVVRAPPTAEVDRERARFRLVGSSAAVGVFTILAAACLVWIAGELGDRLSNHHSPEEDAFCTAMALPILGVGLLFGAASFVAFLAALVAVQRRRVAVSA